MPATRQIRVRLDILNMDGDTLSTISNRIIDGQVNVAADAEGPTRSMSVSLFDPSKSLRFDSDSPQDGSLAADRMLRAWYGVEVPGVGWVDVPVFTGPIVKISRDASTLNVECQGKEALALETVWRAFTVEKGVQKVDAIRRVLRERAGETTFDLPDLAPRLPDHATLTPREPEKRDGMNAQTPWGLAKMIAESMSRQLFYDGMGRCRLRKLPGSPVFTFDEGLIAAEPQIEFDLQRSRNAVKVTGKTLHEGKEKKQQIPTHVVSGEAVAPRDHPLSPWRLGRRTNGGDLIPRYLPEFVTNDAIRSDKEATERAEQILRNRLAQEVGITFDSLPVPHLEELDLIRVKYGDMRMNARLRRFSLPLTHDGVMSVGYVKRVSRPRRSRRG